MADLNSNDIESIQVLKDAASTSIYGARANGGVILIETKQGKKGHTEVNYSFKSGFSYMNKGYGYMNAGDYLYYNRMGAFRYNNSISGYGGSFNPDGQQGYGTNNSYYDVTYADTERGEALIAAGAQTMTDPFTGKTLAYMDYAGIADTYVFNDAAFSQDHHINLDGGNDKGTFNVGLGYYSEDGTIQLTNYKRFNAKMNGSYRVLPFLTVKGSTEYTWSTAPNLYLYEYSLFYRTRSQRPTWNPVDEEGNPKAGFGSSDGNYQYWANVYDMRNSTRRQVYSGGFDLDILPGILVLTGNASLLNYDYQYEYFTRTWQQTNSASPNTTHDAQALVSRYVQEQFNTQLHYTDTFKEKHNVDFMLGGEYYHYRGVL